MPAKARRPVSGHIQSRGNAERDALLKGLIQRGQQRASRSAPLQQQEDHPATSGPIGPFAVILRRGVALHRMARRR